MSWRDCTTIAPVSAYHHRSYTERYSRFNQYHQDVILVAITSHVPEVLMSDEYLLNDAEQREAGLPKRSIVKVGKIVTLAALDSQTARPHAGDGTAAAHPHCHDDLWCGLIHRPWRQN